MVIGLHSTTIHRTTESHKSLEHGDYILTVFTTNKILLSLMSFEDKFSFNTLHVPNMNMTSVGSTSVLVTCKELYLFPLQYVVVHDYPLYLVCPDLLVAVGETC